MNTFIALEKLEEIDLHDYHEVWLTTTETWPQDPATVERKCLWRVDRDLTQDVEIDEVYFQNLPRLWLVVDSLTDQTATGITENALKTRLTELDLPGEFYPAESHQTPCGEDVNKDLRS